MSSNSQPEGEILALRERIAALSTAILRVNASLDVDTVLHHIAAPARSAPTPPAGSRAPATPSSSPLTRCSLSRTPLPPASRPTKGGRSRGGPTTWGVAGGGGREDARHHVDFAGSDGGPQSRGNADAKLDGVGVAQRCGGHGPA